MRLFNPIFTCGQLDKPTHQYQLIRENIIMYTFSIIKYNNEIEIQENMRDKVCFTL